MNCIVLVVLIATRVSLVFSHDELVLANVLYRHGSRSPTRFFPTNPHKKNAWPDGLGQLTQIGMNMEYELGIYFQERYVHTKFINQSYLHKEVYIRSSGVDRCLQSAESQLAGLYPPYGTQIWRKGLMWQPIPVQTVPTNQDPLLIPQSTDCPKLVKIWESMMQSDQIKKKEHENRELLNYMTNHSGQVIKLQNIWDVTDDLLCEQAEHMNSSQWAMERFNEILKLSNWASNFLYQGTDEMGKLLGGALLGVMVDNMKKMRDGNTKGVHKLNIFSGHDTSLLAMTTALNMEFPVPTFAACIFIDMYKRPEGDYYVIINYRNGIENETRVTNMNLTGCEYECALSDFIRLTEKRIPTDRAKECHDPPGFFTKKRLQVLSAVLFSLAVFFFILIVWMCFRKRFRGGGFCKQRQEKKKPARKTVNFSPHDDKEERENLIT